MIEGLERETGFEPATLALARRCSTTELFPLPADRKEDGIVPTSVQTVKTDLVRSSIGLGSKSDLLSTILSVRPIDDSERKDRRISEDRRISDPHHLVFRLSIAMRLLST